MSKYKWSAFLLHWWQKQEKGQRWALLKSWDILFTNWRTYVVDVSHKRVSLIWHTSCDVSIDIDVSNIPLAKDARHEEVYDIEIATASSLEIYKSPVHSSKLTLLLVSHGEGARWQVKHSKEGNERGDTMCKEPAFAVKADSIKTSIKLLDVTKRFQLTYTCSTFLPNTLYLPLSSLQRFSEWYLWWLVFQMFLKVIREAEVYDEDQDRNRSLKFKEEGQTLKTFCNWQWFSLPIPNPICSSNKSSLQGSRSVRTVWNDSSSTSAWEVLSHGTMMVRK